MFMPFIVNAEEIPREGVTYFLEYPDGTEDVKEDYDEAIAASEEEKLIFTGQTDENGQVVLENIASEGTLRVVQEVPNGYSTNQREIIINLQENKKVEFRNTNGLLNPKTGFSILSILLVLGLVIGAAILTRKNKKTLLVLPLLLLVGLVKVNADSDNLVIDIKDNSGKAQSGVTVKIYAKPIIEAAPAVKFDANGGHFFNGKTEMYVRIPNNGCTIDDYYDSSDESTYNYLYDNISGAYRNGYYRYIDWFDPSTTLTNGLVLQVEWEEDQSAQLMTIHGNGGYLDFYGEKLNDVVAYKGYHTEPVRASSNSSSIQNESVVAINKYYYRMTPYELELNFVKDGEYNIGSDLTTACSSYNQYGVYNNNDNYYEGMPNDIYVCWHEKPDGFYINADKEYVFFGNVDNCFSHGYAESSYGNLELYTYYERLNITSIYDNYPAISLYLSSTPSSGTISKLEIVYHGNTITTMSSSDFELGGGSCYGNTGSCYTVRLANQTKLTQLRNHLNDYYNNSACYQETVMY